MRAATVKKTNASGEAISAAELAFGAAEEDAEEDEEAVLLADEARVLLEVVPDGLAVVTVELDDPVELATEDEAVVVALVMAVMEERTEDADEATDERDAELETLERTEDMTEDALADADDNADETDEEAEAAAPPINWNWEL